MIEYFVGTFGECTSLVARLNTLMGYPDQAAKTTKYAEPHEHAAKPGTWLVILKEVNAPKLGRRSRRTEIDNEMTPVERGQVMTRDALIAEGAWPGGAV